MTVTTMKAPEKEVAKAQPVEGEQASSGILHQIRIAFDVDAKKCNPPLSQAEAREFMRRMFSDDTDGSALRQELIDRGAEDTKPRPKKEMYEGMWEKALDVASKAAEAAAKENAVADPVRLGPGTRVNFTPGNHGVAQHIKKLGLGYEDEKGITLVVRCFNQAAEIAYAEGLKSVLKDEKLVVEVRL